MSKAIWITGLCSVAVAAACVTESDDIAVDEHEASLEADGATAASETPEEDTSGRDVERFGCAHILWCSTPGGNTVCKVDNLACSWAEIVLECQQEARLLCGWNHQPIVIVF